MNEELTEEQKALIKAADKTLYSPKFLAKLEKTKPEDLEIKSGSFEIETPSNIPTLWPRVMKFQSLYMPESWGKVRHSADHFFLKYEQQKFVRDLQKSAMIDTSKFNVLKEKYFECFENSKPERKHYLKEILSYFRRLSDGVVQLTPSVKKTLSMELEKTILPVTKSRINEDWKRETIKSYRDSIRQYAEHQVNSLFYVIEKWGLSPSFRDVFVQYILAGQCWMPDRGAYHLETYPKFTLCLYSTASNSIFEYTSEDKKKFAEIGIEKSKLLTPHHRIEMFLKKFARPLKNPTAKRNVSIGHDRFGAKCVKVKLGSNSSLRDIIKSKKQGGLWNEIAKQLKKLGKVQRRARPQSQIQKEIIGMWWEGKTAHDIAGILKDRFITTGSDPFIQRGKQPKNRRDHWRFYQRVKNILRENKYLEELRSDPFPNLTCLSPIKQTRI